MDTRCIVLGVVLCVIGFGLGFAARGIFYPSGTMGTQLSIGEIENLSDFDDNHFDV